MEFASSDDIEDESKIAINLASRSFSCSNVIKKDELFGTGVFGDEIDFLINKNGWILTGRTRLLITGTSPPLISNDEISLFKEKIEIFENPSLQSHGAIATAL